METNDGTASLLLEWALYLTQLANTRHTSKRTSRQLVYTRLRIPRHTCPKSTGCVIILE